MIGVKFNKSKIADFPYFCAMNITDELMDKVARLAKLHLDGAEREALKEDFQRMLDFVGKLQEVDTSGVEPLIHMTEEVNRLRADIPQPPIDRKEMLDNAPETDGAFFMVPKVVKK